MSGLSIEERAELNEARHLSEKRVIDAAFTGLRLWLSCWNEAVDQYSKSGLVEGPPQLEYVLDAFTSVGSRVADLAVLNQRPPAADFLQLLEAAKALELKAVSACQAFAPREELIFEERAAYTVCLMAQGLPSHLSACAEMPCWVIH